MKNKLKKLTSPQLIHTAYKYYEEQNDEIYWECIWLLRTRGTKEIFNLAKRYAYSRDIKYRGIAADILAQFGFKTKQYKGENIFLLGKLLHDRDEDIVCTAIYGLGHKKCIRYGDTLASFITSKSLQIREALSFALGGYENQASIDALIVLMKDKNFNVRNWATFSLAQINETNTQEIRDALFSNLSDKESEVRGEALLGLALRKDERVKEAILEDLQKPFYGSWVFAAIDEMPDNRYLLYFESHIEALDIEDLKAFDSDIKKAQKTLERYKEKE